VKLDEGYQTQNYQSQKKNAFNVKSKSSKAVLGSMTAFHTKGMQGSPKFRDKTHPRIPGLEHVIVDGRSSSLKRMLNGFNQSKEGGLMTDEISIKEFNDSRLSKDFGRYVSPARVGNIYEGLEGRDPMTGEPKPDLSLTPHSEFFYNTSLYGPRFSVNNQRASNEQSSKLLFEVKERENPIEDSPKNIHLYQLQKYKEMNLESRRKKVVAYDTSHNRNTSKGSNPGVHFSQPKILDGRWAVGLCVLYQP
jgi:hypothetical protein